MTIVSKVTAKFTLTAPIVSLRNERAYPSHYFSAAKLAPTSANQLNILLRKHIFTLKSAILNRPALGECEAKAAH